MGSVLLLCCQPSVQAASMEELLERLRNDSYDVRERSVVRIVALWDRWTDSDLQRLRQACDARDPDISVRAKWALRAVLRRRILGPNLMREAPWLEESVLSGDPGRFLGALDATIQSWRAGRLSGADLDRLEIVLVRELPGEDLRLTAAQMLADAGRDRFLQLLIADDLRRILRRQQHMVRGLRKSLESEYR